jgi:hypothetical protein
MSLGLGLGLDVDQSLRQEQTLSLELIIGFHAEFTYDIIDNRIYVYMTEQVQKGLSQRYTHHFMIGSTAVKKNILECARAVVREYYVPKYLPMPLSYSLQNNKTGSTFFGYVIDKFGHGEFEEFFDETDMDLVVREGNTIDVPASDEFALSFKEQKNLHYKKNKKK